jgi:hypothetical protein
MASLDSASAALSPEISAVRDSVHEAVRGVTAIDRAQWLVCALLASQAAVEARDAAIQGGHAFTRSS